MNQATEIRCKRVNRKSVNFHVFNMSICVVVLLLAQLCNIVSAKNLDLNHHSGAHTQTNLDTKSSCENVKGFFDTINIKIQPENNAKGSICGGHCCTNRTEDELKQKSTTNFERLLRDHTKSLRGILETTANSFQDHVLELSRQSENKTLNVFSQVYRRMLPLSRQLIHDLYMNIRSDLTAPNENALDVSVHNFFVSLFPIAYHQEVHNSGTTGDLHDDYISCLKHTFDDLKPFGEIPNDLGRSLVASVRAARDFVNALEGADEILASTDELDSSFLTSTCKTHMLKMSYCSQCNGYTTRHIKSCNGYCLNVMRGCLAQYVGVLDIPWSNVAEAIEHLVQTAVQSENGIVNTIKGLDGKLSEAIMRAMENGPELEKKVKKTCGTPKLLPNEITVKNSDIKQAQPLKWATPQDAELLNFLATITKSKDFYSKIVDNLCGDDEYQQNDRHCWTGDRIGDYTQTVMSTGVNAQRYNPEVLYTSHTFDQATKLNELTDKLIKLRTTIKNATPTTNLRIPSDIQADMAHHDEEGSGRLRDDIDDDEYNNIHGSGDDGSGFGPTPTPDFSPISPKSVPASSGTSSSLRQSILTRTGSIWQSLLVLLSILFIVQRH